MLFINKWEQGKRSRYLFFYVNGFHNTVVFVAETGINKIFSAIYIILSHIPCGLSLNIMKLINVSKNKILSVFDFL